ncbi:DUF3618 domain-containing protein [Streptomyces nitrosporeus]|uniref:DUF3618 domain-containing protein n=1 Tax=Streptomyces nitrosporeus TaxID=28894 RepID=UPI0033305C97
MGSQPDELKAEVEDTRAHLARDVDRLADRVAPGKVARRKAGAARHRLTGVRERVMGAAGSARDATAENAQSLSESASGAAEQARETARHAAGQVGGTVRSAPGQVTEQTQGSPLAAGVIAFGAGMLAAALLPTTAAEERAGAQLRDHSDELLGPVRQAAQEAGQEVKEEMRGPATEAVDSLRSTAEEAVQTTRQQAQESGQDAATGLREVGPGRRPGSAGRRRAALPLTPSGDPRKPGEPVPAQGLRGNAVMLPRKPWTVLPDGRPCAPSSGRR